jgi:hypothetical protein
MSTPLPPVLAVVDIATAPLLKLALPVDNRLLITEEDDRLDPPEDKDGVRGNDLEENFFSPVVKLFLKLFGGLVASLGLFEDSLSGSIEQEQGTKLVQY